MSKKPLTLDALVLELGKIAASQCLSDEAREAARRSEDAIRGLRASLELPWETPAADLLGYASNVQATDYLLSLKASAA